MNTRELILSVLDGAFDCRGWQGPNLIGSLRRMKPADAAKSVAGCKSVWEQLLHAAYWKYRVLRHFTGDKSIRFPRPAANWPAVPRPANETAWKADIDMLRDLHRQLRAAVAKAPASKLSPKNLWLLHGSAAHDAYHTGQIKHIRRMLSR